VTSTVLICAGCGAVRERGHWNRAGEARARLLKHRRPADIGICPRCRRLRALPRGYLHIDGAYARRHRRQIEKHIRLAASIAEREGSAGSLLSCVDEGGTELLVTTSTAHLAASLGHSLEQQYDGEIHYGVSPGTPLTHVFWRR
jgi:hypothetical protein